MGFQEFSHLHGIGRVFFHAQGQGLHAAGNEEGVKRTEDGTGHIFETEESNVGDVVQFPYDEAGNDVTVAVQILRCRVNDDVGTEGQRLLDIRRAEGIIDDDRNVSHFMGNLADAFNIGNL